MTYEILQQNRNEAKKTLLPYSRKIDEDERMNESEQSLRSKKKKKKKKKKKRTRTRRGRETFSIAFSVFSLLDAKEWGDRCGRDGKSKKISPASRHFSTTRTRKRPATASAAAAAATHNNNNKNKNSVRKHD